MALNKCAAQVLANITDNCTSPAYAGFKDTGIGIALEDIDAITRDGTNPRKITAITLKDGKKPFAVYNPTSNPFGDSGIEAAFDGARTTFTKNLNFSVPNIGADASLQILEPLANNKTGFLFILPTKNEVADGGFVVIGSEVGAVMSAMTENKTDQATGGSASVTMTETGARFKEVTLTGDSHADAQATFDDLLAKVY